MALLEDVDVKIEVFNDHLLIIFPRKMDDLMIPWQQAYTLGDTIEHAAEAIPNKGIISRPAQAEFDASKFKLNTHKKNVVLIFDHTDRIKLSYEAARIVGRSIKLKAQDLDLEGRGVHVSYKQKGREGRPTPLILDDSQRTFKTS